MLHTISPHTYCNNLEEPNFLVFTYYSHSTRAGGRFYIKFYNETLPLSTVGIFRVSVSSRAAKPTQWAGIAGGYIGPTQFCRWLCQMTRAMAPFGKGVITR